MKKIACLNFKDESDRDCLIGKILFKGPETSGEEKCETSFIIRSSYYDLKLFKLREDEQEEDFYLADTISFKDELKILLEESDSNLISITSSGKMQRLLKKDLTILPNFSYHLSMDYENKEKCLLGEISHFKEFISIATFRFDKEEKKYINTIHLVAIKADKKFLEVHRCEIKNFDRSAKSVNKYVNRMDFTLEDKKSRPLLLFTLKERSSYVYSYIVVRNKIRPFSSSFASGESLPYNLF